MPGVSRVPAWQSTAHDGSGAPSREAPPNNMPERPGEPTFEGTFFYAASCGARAPVFQTREPLAAPTYRLGVRRPLAQGSSRGPKVGYLGSEVSRVLRVNSRRQGATFQE